MSYIEFLYNIIALSVSWLSLGEVQSTRKTEDLSTPANVHVSFVANNKDYLVGAGVAMFSVMQKAAPEDTYHFYMYLTEGLAQSGLSTEEQEAFDSFKERFEGRCELDVVRLGHRAEFDNIHLGHWGTAALVRILLPELLPHLNKVLYMDCDMVAIQDLREVYDQLRAGDDASIAAVTDINAGHQGRVLCDRHQVCGFADNEYVNSGLLVMNLEKLRQSSFKDRVFAWLKDHKADLPDQDAINAVYKGDIKVMDATYAFPTVQNHGNHEGRAKILHFLAQFKPWKDPYVGYADVYFAYKKESSWAKIEHLKAAATEVQSLTGINKNKTQIPSDSDLISVGLCWL